MEKVFTGHHVKKMSSSVHTTNKKINQLKLNDINKEKWKDIHHTAGHEIHNSGFKNEI